MKKIAIAIALCGSLIGGVALAAPKWDANGDGTVDTAEKAQKREQMKARRAELRQERLVRFDANKDGALDRAERQAMRDVLVTEHFKRMDTDGNGQLSLEEVKASRKHFGKRGAGRGAIGGR